QIGQRRAVALDGGLRGAVVGLERRVGARAGANPRVDGREVGGGRQIHGDRNIGTRTIRTQNIRTRNIRTRKIGHAHRQAALGAAAAGPAAAAPAPGPPALLPRALAGGKAPRHAAPAVAERVPGALAAAGAAGGGPPASTAGERDPEEPHT